VGEAVSGYPLVGALVAVLGGSAALLAVAKLRALNRWPFGGHDKDPPETIALGCASAREYTLTVI
jgi:hypothetical protein